MHNDFHIGIKRSSGCIDVAHDNFDKGGFGKVQDAANHRPDWFRRGQHRC